MSSWNFNDNTHPDIPNGQHDYFNAITASVVLPNGLTAGWWLVRRCDVRFNQQICVVTMDGYIDGATYESYVRNNGYPPEPLHSLEVTFGDDVYSQSFRFIEQQLMSVLVQVAAQEAPEFTTHTVMNAFDEVTGFWDSKEGKANSRFLTDFGHGSRDIDGTTDIYGMAWPTVSGATAAISGMSVYDKTHNTKYANSNPYYSTAKAKGKI